MIYWLARMSGFWDAAEIGPGRSRIENDANDPTRTSAGSKSRSARLAKGEVQADIARSINVSQATISRLA